MMPSHSPNLRQLAVPGIGFRKISWWVSRGCSTWGSARLPKGGPRDERPQDSVQRDAATQRIDRVAWLSVQW
jgi:hypothetical protein